MKNKNRKWTMRDGSKIRLRDMDDQHLWNTFAMMCRNELTVVQRIFARGETAVEHEGDEFIQQVCSEAIDLLVGKLNDWPDRLRKEIERRGQIVRDDIYSPIHTREDSRKRDLLGDIDRLLGVRSEDFPENDHF